MSTKFGWCISGHHNACPVQVSSAKGGLVCGCICHDKAACGVTKPPVKQGETGKIGAQVKTAPAVLAHCDSGALPTNKESTDG